MANVALKREREQYGLPLLAQLVTVAPVEQLCTRLLLLLH